MDKDIKDPPTQQLNFIPYSSNLPSSPEKSKCLIPSPLKFSILPLHLPNSPDVTVNPQNASGCTELQNMLPSLPKELTYGATISPISSNYLEETHPPKELLH
jgi:hypothetical protein